jgi:hypothetical protein
MSFDIMVKNSPKDKNLAIEYAHAVGTAGGDTSQAERILAEQARLLFMLHDRIRMERRCHDSRSK